MTSADEFEKAIKKATKKGVGSRFKGAGRTAPIGAALKAYEESGARNEAQAERAAYLYQVIKNCNTWQQLKAGKTSGNTSGRRRVIVGLYNEAQLELRQYPLIAKALDQYARKKGAGPKRSTGLKDVYAHEGKAYKNLKAQGQFVDPGQPRFAPSATLMNSKSDDPRVQNTTFGMGKTFTNLSFEEFMELDRLLASQYQVLYMSKMQRVSHMVAIEDGKFYRAIDGTEIDMPGDTVESDLGVAQDKDKGEEAHRKDTHIYACDRYGNLFFVKNDLKDKNQQSVQLNHSTLLAGNEVLCAGTISIKKGTLFGITNLSGHYQPDTNALTTMLREWQQNDEVDFTRVLIVDRAQGIETLGWRYLNGDHTDRSKDPLVVRARLIRR